MAHINGIWLIDAPASALNNQGNIEGGRTDNVVGVKYIRSKQGAFPYVSAQAFRFWLRDTMRIAMAGRELSPIYREQKIAYTDSNPIRYWDDDLFGYMRAPSKKAEAKAAREASERANETPTNTDITRVSPLKIGTLVSVAPVSITDDFGVMARHDADAGQVLAGDERPADPVPHEHQFYQTILKGLFDLDLNAAGTFYHRWRTGYRNLDTTRIEEAKQSGLEPAENGQAYRLGAEERLSRVADLFECVSRLEGGAKQTLHYTPVGPSLVIAAVMSGGVSPFQHAIGADERGRTRVKADALAEGLDVWGDCILSPLYVGWRRGFLDEERGAIEKMLADSGIEFTLDDPRRVFRKLADDLRRNAAWME